MEYDTVLWRGGAVPRIYTNGNVPTTSSQRLYGDSSCAPSMWRLAKSRVSTQSLSWTWVEAVYNRSNRSLLCVYAKESTTTGKERRREELTRRMEGFFSYKKFEIVSPKQSNYFHTRGGHLRWLRPKKRKHRFRRRCEGHVSFQNERQMSLWLTAKRPSSKSSTKSGLKKWTWAGMSERR